MENSDKKIIADKFRDDNRIITRENYEEEGAEFVELKNDKGLTVCRYYTDGYKFLRVYIGEHYKMVSDDVKFKIAYRTAVALAALNMDKDADVLSEYLTLILSCGIDNDKFSVNRDTLKTAISKTLAGNLEPKYLDGKYMWLYALPLNIKRRIVAKNSSNTKGKRYYELVEGIVEMICNDDDYSDLFITHDFISDEIGSVYNEYVSTKTVGKYARVFKEEIDDHNVSVCGYPSWTMYQRICTVYKIADAIQAMSKIDKRVSKREIGRMTGYHYNTVANVWDETDVVDALNKYNESKKLQTA